MVRQALQTTEQLLNALRADQTPAGWESDCAPGGIAWDDLVVRAIVLGLAPQLYDRLRQWELAIPPRASAKLAVTYQAQVARSAAIFHQLAEILSHCRQLGLQPIALKGIHLAALVYPEPALRPMNDIDLLFAPEELVAAETMLAALGYRGKQKSPEIGPGITKHTSTFRRGAEAEATPNPYLSAKGERMVEPHGSLEESWFGLKVDVTPGVRQRAVGVTLADQPGRVLANEDVLLHLCVHFCFHLIMGAPALVQLTDLLAVTTRVPVDWTLFASRAHEQRAAPYALAGLTLARRVLAAPVPEASLTSLQAATPAPLRRRIERLSLADVLRRTQQRPLVSIPQRIGRGLRDRAETARWALGWRERWRVWQTALRVGRSDTGRLILGK
jgi:hypothetical protein